MQNHHAEQDDVSQLARAFQKYGIAVLLFKPIVSLFQNETERLSSVPRHPNPGVQEVAGRDDVYDGQTL